MSIGDFNLCRFDNLVIHGNTNISKFFLTYQETVLDSTQEVFYNLDEQPLNSLLNFNIPIQYIKGKNRAMLTDFHELFKAKDYPNIIVGINRNQLIDLNKKLSAGDMEFEITIAGVSRMVESQYLVEDSCNDKISLNGCAKLKLSDFNIQPPVKFFGIIKVKNEVFINFRILLCNSF